jgi:hypothetical protein
MVGFKGSTLQIQPIHHPLPPRRGMRPGWGGGRIFLGQDAAGIEATLANRYVHASQSNSNSVVNFISPSRGGIFCCLTFRFRHAVNVWPTSMEAGLAGWTTYGRNGEKVGIYALATVLIPRSQATMPSRFTRGGMVIQFQRHFQDGLPADQCLYGRLLVSHQIRRQNQRNLWWRNRPR